MNIEHSHLRISNNILEICNNCVFSVGGYCAGTLLTSSTVNYSLSSDECVKEFRLSKGFLSDDIRLYLTSTKANYINEYFDLLNLFIALENRILQAMQLYKYNFSEEIHGQLFRTFVGYILKAKAEVIDDINRNELNSKTMHTNKNVKEIVENTNILIYHFKSNNQT